MAGFSDLFGSQIILSVTFSWTDTGLCIYHIISIVKFLFFAQFSVSNLSFQVVPSQDYICISIMPVYCIHLLSD